MRSLPEHSYAKLKQRDDKSLVLTFLDWASVPLSGLDVRCWHQTDILRQSPHVCCWAKNGPSSDTPRGRSLTRNGHWVRVKGSSPFTEPSGFAGLLS